MVIHAPRGTEIVRPCDDGEPDLTVGEHEGLEAVRGGSGASVAELPLQPGSGQWSPVMVAVDAGSGGELRMSQRRGDGELSAGYSIMA